MNPRKQKLKYIIADIISSILAWTLFVIYRQLYILPEIPRLYFNYKYFLGLIILPVFWLFLYYISGFYKDIYRKSRFIEFWNTFFIVLIGSILFFFILILDDYISDYKYFYYSFEAIFILQFVFTYLPRVLITSFTHKKIRNGTIGFNTLIIGSNSNAYNYFKLLNKKPKFTGNKFIGFISVKNSIFNNLKNELEYLGTIDSIVEIVEKHKIEEVLIAIEKKKKKIIERILIKLSYLDITVKATPNIYDVITGLVKISSIYGVPLMQLKKSLMPTWEETLKRFIDLGVSLLALVLLSPLLLAIIIIVKITSKGPAFYSHERIGLHGKPFTIYKFRSMVVDAESDGPMLSSDNDSRITGVGRFLRKTRLDELPQFYNVLIGDMSLVGPRPERLFYIKQIAERNPLYYRLYKVKPGITSWSAIKIGYTENIEQMIQRLHYDLIYIENMSILLDIKIMIHTILTVIKGEGK